MAKIEKVDMKSKDIKSEQVEKLKMIFPEIVADGKINFEQLKATLGEEIEDSKERFGMTWAGKSKCFRIIQDPSTGTLKPSREESVNFDTTENLFIEGDNLEVLKLLQKSYYEKIKMIYIDPPYNTGNDFVYNDKFGQQLNEYLKITGQTNEDGKKISTNTDSSGRFHSNWMNMMYPRLFLARNLLLDSGLIFISIDDNEYANLKQICDEVFGESNFIGDIVWNSTKSVTNTALISVSHTYNLVYAKNKDYFVANRTDFRLPESGEGFSNPDNDPRGPWKADPFQVGGWRPNQQYEIKNPKTGKIYTPNVDCSWKNDHNKFKELMDDNRIVFGVNGDAGPQRKRFLSEATDRGKVTKTIWDDVETTTNGTQMLKKILGGGYFDNPKPISLIQRMIQLSCKKDSIILDFFAGSGTTAHAVLDLNNKDGGNRKFICVQLPELVDEKSETYKAGYKYISDLSKERIRRVIVDLRKELVDNNKQTKLDGNSDKNIDLGFRVFKLDKSNFKKWDNQTETLQTSLSDHVEQIKSNSNPEDVLYEILIKDGFELTTKINKTQIKLKDIYSVENNLLLICLDEKLDLDLFKEMKKLNPHLVIVLDKGFKDNDQLKTNAVQTLGKNSDEEYILRSI
jgi:adenine-specific DNA-methyltransferase